MRSEGDINYRRIPWLNDLLQGMQRRLQRQIQAISVTTTNCNNRKYHIASNRLVAIILLGGSVDRTLTWSGGGFDNTDYIVEMVPLDLEGQATLTEIGRTTTTITIRVTASIQVSLGSTFMVFGRSL